MSIFVFEQDAALGEVRGVDTAQVYVRVLSADKLSHARVGRLVAIQGHDQNEWVVGMVNRVWRDPISVSEVDSDDQTLEENAVQVTLVGTYRAKQGTQLDYFTRAVLALPDINRPVFPIEESVLEGFMGIIGRGPSSDGEELKSPLLVGTYVLDRKARAYLDGDKLFQRHAALVGSTGTGKSWAVANLLEQAAQLAHSNVILFDLHGEYTSLPYAQQIRVAGPNDLDSIDENVLFLPYWLLTYDEMQSLLIDNSEQSAPNQAMIVLEAVTLGKQKTLSDLGLTELLASFTVDSPVPFPLGEFEQRLAAKDEEVEDTGEVYASGPRKGLPKTINGPMHGKLTRLLIRLRNKIGDRRYGFLFKPPNRYMAYEALHNLAFTLMGHGGLAGYGRPGVKVINFSEVPSDVLPVMVSLVARLVFQLQFWADPGTDNEGRHPILLICDEAHLYLPASSEQIKPLERRALENFERIAKEGRKYGVGLMIVSQRPSDVSQTILSQCNNIMSLRLTNERDKAAVKSLLPDSLNGLVDFLPGLEVGEAVVVGDATLLPTRIVLNKPAHKPKSATINFWRRWERQARPTDLVEAAENLRRQGRTTK